jgi:hypothetical protein
MPHNFTFRVNEEELALLAALAKELRRRGIARRGTQADAARHGLICLARELGLTIQANSNSLLDGEEAA